MARAPELGDLLARRRLSNEFGIPDDSRLLPCIAHAIGRFFLRAESPEGIFRDCYDLKREYFGGYLGIGEHQEFKDLVNSRCNGEAMKQYVRLYAALADHGIETPEFLGKRNEWLPSIAVTSCPQGRLVAGGILRECR
jgi:hypothetical protein